MPSSVLIVGTLALDDIETLSAKRTDIVGGAGYYAAMAATLFAPVNLVGVIGDDFPQNASKCSHHAALTSQVSKQSQDGNHSTGPASTIST